VPNSKSDPLAEVKSDIAWIKRVGWTIAGGIAVIFGGLITWYLPKEFDSTRIQISGDTTKQLGPLSQDIAVLKSQIASIIPQLMNEKLKAKGVGLKDALESVASIAKDARIKRLETDPNAVGQVGKNVLRIGETTPEFANAAWQTTAELLDYHSFLNSTAIPDLSSAIPVTSAPVPFDVGMTGRAIPPYAGYPYPAIPVNIQVQYIGPISSTETSALLEPLGTNAATRRAQQGPKYYVIRGKGFEFSLDDYRMRNVIFLNSSIAYEGGPTAMQNVYFVDCTFKFKPTPDWKRLGETLFSKASVDFSKTISP
jgi:hypothetical protein